MPKGMPMMVMKQSSALAMWPMASQIPANMNHMIFPMAPRTPVPMSLSLVQLLPADGHLAEGEERETADHKAGLPPGNPHNGDKRQQAVQPPGQAHNDAPEYKPDQVSDCSHGFWLVSWFGVG
jgi:hypothetical protein